jgi:uncharacterized protein YjiS (DUF1127 family)
MEMAMTESHETNSDESELLTLDDRKLTPQQWEHFKRRAQDARTRAMRDLLDGVLSSLRDAAAGGWDIIRACGHWGAEAAGKGWSAYAARRVRSRAIRELNALDDRSLKDIGVNRSEILSVIYGREWTRTTERAIAPVRCQPQTRPSTSHRPKGPTKRSVKQAIAQNAA